MRSAKPWRLLSAAALASSLAVSYIDLEAQATVRSSDAADGSVIELDLSDGGNLTIDISNGLISINGREIALLDGDGVRSDWREVLAQLQDAEPAFSRGANGEWNDVAPAVSSAVQNAIRSAMRSVETSAGSDAGAREERLAELSSALADVTAGSQEIAIARGQLAQTLSQLGQGSIQLDLENAVFQVGAFEVRADQSIDGTIVVLGGDVAVKGTITGDLLAFGGDIRLFRGSHVGGDVVSVDGTVTGSTSLVDGTVRSIASNLDLPRVGHFELERSVSAPVAVGSSIMTLLATLIAFGSIGFGVTFFAPEQLETVARRVAESPGRSFLAGLFAQPLILPLVAMLAVGLAISIVGIILIPFAILAALLGVAGAILVGYLAVARALGAKHAKQRAQRLGRTAEPSPFEAMVRGLVIMLAVWLPAVLLSWAPLVGLPLAVLALMFTWAIATAGLGAVLTTRAGFQDRINWRSRGTLRSVSAVTNTRA